MLENHFSRLSDQVVFYFSRLGTDQSRNLAPPARLRAGLGLSRRSLYQYRQQLYRLSPPKDYDKISVCFGFFSRM